MKIPEANANVGAYYGNEENGQWQPNGVIIDSGVGGGVVGSGDAGIHRPQVYPLHIPRDHVPAAAGYVMAGAYFPPAGFAPVPAPPPDDFADYMWMENEEEFDKQVMQQLEEEALMEQCIEAMLEDEQRERQHRPVANGHNNHYPTTSNGTSSLSLEEAVSRSTLNPLAAEFVPTRARPPAPGNTDEKQETPEITNTEESPKQTQKTAEESIPEPQNTVSDSTEEHTELRKTKEPSTPKEPPEVSAAGVHPITEKIQEQRPKDIKKETRTHIVKVEAKKPTKTEIKPKAKPQTVKSETKVQPKKKDVKPVKSETKPEEKIEEIIVPVIEAIKPQTIQSEPTTQAPSGFKPINYAAAAKANKPKKPSPPPTTEKATPPPTKTDKPKITDKLEKREKTSIKTEKPAVQRKNSAK